MYVYASMLVDVFLATVDISFRLQAGCWRGNGFLFAVLAILVRKARGNDVWAANLGDDGVCY